MIESSSYEISDAGKLVEQPLVSAVVLAYNHERYIAQAVASIVDQRRDFTMEIIIGEDGSTDATRAIILAYQLKYPDLIRIVTADHNVGVFLNYQRLLAA